MSTAADDIYLEVANYDLHKLSLLSPKRKANQVTKLTGKPDACGVEIVQAFLKQYKTKSMSSVCRRFDLLYKKGLLPLKKETT